MKNVIEQIRKIKSIITVEPFGVNGAVVLFEVEEQKPKSLSPDELVDGKIYVDQYSKDWCNIFRFHDQQSRVYSILNTNNGLYSGHSSCYLSYSDMIRPATQSEAQTLIRAEIANDFFFELK